MSSVDALLRLGDRYAALGLHAAAMAVFERALPQSPIAARRLAELCLAAGDGKRARRHAEEAARRAPGAAARLLVARSLAAAGELAAARFAFAAVLDAPGVDAGLRAAAYLGRADVAASEGDAAGALAHLAAAVDELTFVTSGTPDGKPQVTAEEALLVEELAQRAVSLGRSGELAARIAEFEARRRVAVLELLRAALGAANQAHGEPGISDADIEAALERALAADPTSRPIRLRLALRLSRRRYRDAEARARAVSILETLAAELSNAAPAADLEAERSPEDILHDSIYEDDPALRERAEEQYRAGLRLRPRHAAAANNLAVLALGVGDQALARKELGRALRLDPEYDVAWLNAARLLDATLPAGALADDVAGWLDAAVPGAGQAAPAAARLVRATAESAAQAVLEALYAKGHRLKNLLGIAGARVRSARKAAVASAADLPQRLEELERELGAVYDEWAAHLRTLQAEGPRLEIVPMNPLVAEIVAAATQEGRPYLRFVPGPALPDLRGDRALLKEALLNIVVNALDAQDAAGERDRPVEISTRAVVAGGGAPVVEVEIKDRGGGIARGDLSKIFAPGFTTKEHGSGLGLALSNRVVAAHHGRIHIDSEVDRGTTVTIVLPSDLGGFSSLAPTLVSRAEP